MKFIFLLSFIIPYVLSAAINPDKNNENLINSVLKSQAKNKNFVSNNDDPEIRLEPNDIIAYWGYPVEQYKATTADGYSLMLLRIPHGRNPAEYANANSDTNSSTAAPKKPVVFLQHGLDGSYADWVTNLPNQAAAFLFADAGFDVWLGNFRGNKYGRFHKTLKPSDHAFWEFSWDQMAQYDLPAMIDLALETSQADNLYYVGFSLGTTTAFAKLSQDREFSKKIKKFYALAPVATAAHIYGPLRLIAPFTGTIETLSKIFGVDEFQPNEWFMDLMAKYFCGGIPFSDLLCKNVLFLIGGPDSKQLNTTRLPVYLAHSPGGTSTRTMVHMGQMIQSGKFQAYDYGSRFENRKHYQQDKPPQYDLTAIETPVVVYSGGQDWLADPKDVSNLITKLRNLNDNVYLAEYNDFDFIWGLRAAPEIYWPIRKDIQLDFAATSH